MDRARAAGQPLSVLVGDLDDFKDFNDWEDAHGGGSHVTFDSDLPGLRGPTFVGQKLGIDSLSKVP